MNTTPQEIRQLREILVNMTDDYWKEYGFWASDAEVVKITNQMRQTSTDFGTNWLEKLIWC